LYQSTHSRVASSTSASVFHGPFAVDLLGLVDADRGLGQAVVARVADRLDGLIHAALQQNTLRAHARAYPADWDGVTNVD
jgi:hypothetical protein